MMKLLKTKSRWIIGALVVVGISVVVVLMLQGSSVKTLALKKQTFTIEYGESIPTSSEYYLKNELSKEEYKQFKVSIKKADNEEGKEYPAVGTYKGTIKGNDTSISFKVKVADTSAPTLVDVRDTINIQRAAQNVAYERYFKIEDLSSCQIEIDTSLVDLQTLGTYEAVLKASDEYNNIEEKNIIINVVETSEEASNYVDSEEKPVRHDVVEESTNTNTNTTSNQASGNITTMAPGPVVNTSSGTINEAMNIINQRRASLGLAALSYDSGALQQAANQRAGIIVNNFSHDNFVDALTNCGVSFWSCGENIYMGTDANYVDATNAWMNSPGHYANMMSGDFTRVAIGKYGDYYAMLLVG